MEKEEKLVLKNERMTRSFSLFKAISLRRAVIIYNPLSAFFNPRKEGKETRVL